MPLDRARSPRRSAPLTGRRRRAVIETSRTPLPTPRSSATSRSIPGREHSHPAGYEEDAAAVEVRLPNLGAVGRSPGRCSGERASPTRSVDRRRSVGAELMTLTPPRQRSRSNPSSRRDRRQRRRACRSSDRRRRGRWRDRQIGNVDRGRQIGAPVTVTATRNAASRSPLPRPRRCCASTPIDEVARAAPRGSRRGRCGRCNATQWSPPTMRSRGRRRSPRFWSSSNQHLGAGVRDARATAARCRCRSPSQDPNSRTINEVARNPATARSIAIMVAILLLLPGASTRALQQSGRARAASPRDCALPLGSRCVRMPTTTSSRHTPWDRRDHASCRGRPCRQRHVALLDRRGSSPLRSSRARRTRSSVDAFGQT